MKGKARRGISLVLAAGLLAGLAGCAGQDEGKTTIELLSYKMEAVDLFNDLAAQFNAENPDLNLVISSPNEAMTILKTRLVRNDPPDMVGLGGDVDFSNLVDADMLMDISDYPGLAQVKESYLEIDKQLELVPTDGVFAVPYMANAAGVLYNGELFDRYGWQVPETWSDFMALCQEIQAAGIAPFTFGYKDTWTCLAPWNALAVDLTDTELFSRVSLGEDSFANAYSQVADKQYQLLQYSGNDAFSYGYNDACTAFARGQAAMYPIGSYAIAQIKSVNPDMDIRSFVMPGSDNLEENVLNSGIDLQFVVIKDTQNKEACYRVLEFFQRAENVQRYMDEQTAVSCQEGDFTLSPHLAGMEPYLDAGRLADFPDHHYPSEMGADAMIQTFLINGDKASFLSRFDTNWTRYSRDTIAKQKAYYEALEKEGA